MSPPGQLTHPAPPHPPSASANLAWDREALEAIEARLDYDAAHRYVHGDIFKAGVPK